MATAPKKAERVTADEAAVMAAILSRPAKFGGGGGAGGDGEGLTVRAAAERGFLAEAQAAFGGQIGRWSWVG